MSFDLKIVDRPSGTGQPSSRYRDLPGVLKETRSPGEVHRAGRPRSNRIIGGVAWMPYSSARAADLLSRPGARRIAAPSRAPKALIGMAGTSRSAPKYFNAGALVGVDDIRHQSSAALVVPLPSHAGTGLAARKFVDAIIQRAAAAADVGLLGCSGRGDAVGLVDRPQRVLPCRLGNGGFSDTTIGVPCVGTGGASEDKMPGLTYKVSSTPCIDGISCYGKPATIVHGTEDEPCAMPAAGRRVPLAVKRGHSIRRAGGTRSISQCEVADHAGGRGSASSMP